jgi:hypothetical protein
MRLREVAPPDIIRPLPMTAADTRQRERLRGTSLPDLAHGHTVAFGGVLCLTNVTPAATVRAGAI